ncbi:MAG: SPOR domain-containing protein [Pseudomonadota bacterium]
MASKPAKTGDDALKPMDEQTRYRVTGSLFLLAVAVIVFPMLFDGAGLERLELEPLDVAQETPNIESLEDVAPASDVSERAAALADTVDAGGFQTDATGTRFGEPVLSRAEAETSVWAVQVASFGEEANALKLRDELRSDGREAFISTVRQGDEVLSRVAVGPFLDEAEALRLRDALSDDLDLDTRVVAFSN